MFGVIYINKLSKEKPLKKVKISLIQQNSDPRRHYFHKTFIFLKKLTDDSIRKWGETPDLVVWPEGAFKMDIRYFFRDGNLKYLDTNDVANLIEFVKDRNVWFFNWKSGS